jgi:predicted nucleic acid-binding protein
VIVVDAGVVVTALVDDEADGRVARDRLRGESLAAPELLDVEVLSVVRRLASAGRLSPARAQQAIDDLVALRVQRAAHRPLVPRCWELRDNLTPYDAAYVALAEALDATLLTADRRLAGAPGPNCSIEVLTGEGEPG